MAAEASAIADYALRLGDDALVLGQRMCEWVACAPILEEDIALANVGLDYFGRARMALQYAGSMTDKNEDELAFLRDAGAFTNLLMVELPNGDFAFSMVRQYLLDEYEVLFFAELERSRDPMLAGLAEKTAKEVAYHVRRSREWIKRFGLGTDESRCRAQLALDELWGYVDEFFAMDELESGLLDAGIAVDRRALEVPWRAAVTALIAEAELYIPDHGWQVNGGRQGVHTEHLSKMLSEMQYLQRTYPGLEW